MTAKEMCKSMSNKNLSYDYNEYSESIEINVESDLAQRLYKTISFDKEDKTWTINNAWDRDCLATSDDEESLIGKVIEELGWLDEN